MLFINLNLRYRNIFFIPHYSAQNSPIIYGLKCVYNFSVIYTDSFLYGRQILFSKRRLFKRKTFYIAVIAIFAIQIFQGNITACYGFDYRIESSILPCFHQIGQPVLFFAPA